MKKLYFLLLIVTGICQAQIVTIPDNLFKARLLEAAPENTIAYGNGGYIKIDSNNDGEIQLAEAQAIDSLNVRWAQMSDITGVEAFTNLKKLDCSSNSLSALNITALTNLRILNCKWNQLTALNVGLPGSLQWLSCGSNNIAALSLSGLNQLEYLDCESDLLTALDITNLPTLKELWCSGPQLTSVGIGNATSLEVFHCGGAHQLTTLDFSGAANLKYLDCNYNNLSSLNISGLAHLEKLYCEDNSIANLNLSGLTALKDFRCTQNQLTSLDLSGLTTLETFLCASNHISSLDFNGLANLQFLNCGGNELTTLNIDGLVNLIEFGCGVNQLTALNIHDLPLLRTINCGGNQLTTLSLASLNNLHGLYCSENLLTTLDVSGLINLNSLDCDHNQLATLDCSANINLTQLNFMTNPIHTLYIKNGRFQQYPTSIEGGTGPIDIANTPLQFICGDDFELNYWNSIFQNTLSTTSYCPFTGGAHNNITGTVRFDSDLNGCNSSDPAFSNVRIDITDGIYNGATFTTSLGSYNFYVQAPSLTLTPAMENASYFTITPNSTTLNFTENNNSTQTQDFCITPNGLHNDLEVVINSGNARPGFDSTYELVYKNKGNQTLSGTVNLAFDDLILDFVSAMPNANAQGSGSLTWTYANLLPFETRTITITLNLNSPMETPPGNSGDILHLTASVSPLIGDELPGDNVFELNQTVVNSFDPNNKICLEGNSVNPSKIGDYLHYAINFENTGTAAADKIVIKDIIDTAKFDVNSLQVLNSSHPMTVKINGNKVEFIFENIQLAQNEHGNVNFKIKTKANLTAGMSVANKADIYFDYNFPVETNTATSVFQLLNTKDFETDHSVFMSPNPADDLVKIKAGSNITSVSLFDVQGRIIAVYPSDSQQTELNISGFSRSVYFVKIVTDNGMKIEKIIKK